MVILIFVLPMCALVSEKNDSEDNDDCVPFDERIVNLPHSLLEVKSERDNPINR